MIDWGTLSTTSIAAVTVGSVVVGVATRMIRHTLRASFATIGQVNLVVERLEAVERKLELVPNSQSIAGFGVRLGGVEQNVAVARETISGVKDGLARVEHMMGLLLEAELRKEEGGSK